MSQNTESASATATTYERTLSRWHKVVERLTAELNQHFTTATQELSIADVREYLGESQVEQLHQQTERGLEALERASTIQSSITQIRTAVGAANQTHGITALVAEQDALQRRLQVMKTILAKQKGVGAVRPEELSQVRPPSPKPDFYSRSGTIPVRVMNTAQQRQVAEESAALAVRIYALSDVLADRNRALLRIAVPKDMAALAAL